MKLSGVTKMVKRQLVCNVFHNIHRDQHRQLVIESRRKAGKKLCKKVNFMQKCSTRHLFRLRLQGR